MTGGFADGGQVSPLAAYAPVSQAEPSFAPSQRTLMLRGRLLAGGARFLDDADATEALLGFAIRADVTDLAARVLRRFGSYTGLLAMPTRELEATPGLGPHSLAAVRLVQGAAVRLSRATVMDRPVLHEWGRLIDYLTAALARERVEQFRVLFLDSGARLIADEAQARGTVNHTPVYPREVMKRALEVEADSIILVHNHPSGDPTPSREDLAMTAQIGEAGALLSVGLVDHIIVGNGKWTSFRQEGLL